MSRALGIEAIDLLFPLLTFPADDLARTLRASTIETLVQAIVERAGGEQPATIALLYRELNQLSDEEVSAIL